MLAPKASFIADGAGKLHSLVGEKKGSFSVSLSQMFPIFSAGASLLTSNLLLRSILKFSCVGTALEEP